MEKSPRAKNPGAHPQGGQPKPGAGAPAHLPDPKRRVGPCRPFASDPSWSEAWWWLVFPVLMAAFTLGSFLLAPDFYERYVIPEGFGVLEFSQFLLALGATFVAGSLLFLPFVKARPFVYAVALIGALGSLYIAGEEVSWGQHFFHWSTPDAWGEINRQDETNLHNTYFVFEKLPRSILEVGIVIGGLLVPLAASFYPWISANRFSLFLPAACIVPTALGAMLFKLIDKLQQNIDGLEIAGRPSEGTELFLYLFILVYFITYARRLKELEIAEHALPK